MSKDTLETKAKIYDTKLESILQSLRWIMNNPTGAQEVESLLDNKTAADRLVAGRPFPADYQQRLGIPHRIRWVPGHSGIRKNELAKRRSPPSTAPRLSTHP
jgi:hypothetical protein